MTRWTPCAFRRRMKSAVGRVECPIVKTRSDVTSTLGHFHLVAFLAYRGEQRIGRGRESLNGIRL
jgi:hypothetical protein